MFLLITFQQIDRVKIRNLITDWKETTWNNFIYNIFCTDLRYLKVVFIIIEITSRGFIFYIKLQNNTFANSSGDLHKTTTYYLKFPKQPLIIKYFPLEDEIKRFQRTSITTYDSIFIYVIYFIQCHIIHLLSLVWWQMRLIKNFGFAFDWELLW